LRINKREAAALSLCLSAAVFICAAMLFDSVQQRQTYVEAASLSGGAAFSTVVVDPGHGGVDGGAVSSEGVAEKDINLNISQMLERCLSFCGYNVVMTRESDVSIHDPSCSSIREKKVSDLKNRLKIINGQTEAVFISIHLNSFPDASQRGAQFFYADEDNIGYELANAMQRNAAGLIDGSNDRAAKKCGDSIFLMKNSEIPAVLAECGFLSNPQEAQMLCTQEYQSKLAFAVFVSILQCNNINY